MTEYWLIKSLDVGLFDMYTNVTARVLGRYSLIFLTCSIILRVFLKLFSRFFCPRIDIPVSYGFCSVCPLLCRFVRKRTFDVASNFWMVTDRAYIIMFHMCIPCGKSFSSVPRSKSSVKAKVKYEGHNLQKNGRNIGIYISQTFCSIFRSIWKLYNVELVRQYELANKNLCSWE